MENKAIFLLEVEVGAWQKRFVNLFLSYGDNKQSSSKVEILKFAFKPFR